MLEINTKAPIFVLKNQINESISLEDFRGHYVVVYFYPKDDTPGCTIEACAIRDNYTKLEEKAVVIGISSDSPESHQQFAEKYHLPFILLSDPKKEVIELYKASGVFTKRITYIVNPEGKIAKVYDKVTPATHAEELIHDLVIFAHESQPSKTN